MQHARRLAAIGGLTATLAFASAADAQPSETWQQCTNDKQDIAPDVSIRACDVIIEAGKDIPANLAIARFSRGNAFWHTGDADRAIADYNEAIRLDPKMAAAFVNRGEITWRRGDFDGALRDFGEAQRLEPTSVNTHVSRGLLYRMKGDEDNAIADFTEAIRIEPGSAIPFNNRGLAYSAKLDHERAISDFSDAVRIDPEYINPLNARGRAYFDLGNYRAAATDLSRVVSMRPDFALSVLWLYLARIRTGDQTAAAQLAASAGQLNWTEWPYPVIDLFLGGKTPEAALAAAADPSQRCTALFFVGEWQLQRNARAPAVEALRAAVATCEKTIFEYAGAVAELKRLGERP
jgi:lipoprotein NlpI